MDELYYNGFTFFFRVGNGLYAIDKIVSGTLNANQTVTLKMVDNTVLIVSLQYAKSIFGFE